MPNIELRVCSLERRGRTGVYLHWSTLVIYSYHLIYIEAFKIVKIEYFKSLYLKLQIQNLTQELMV